MLEIQETEAFVEWFADLRDERGRAKILARIRRLSLGSPGDVQPVGGGVSEMRIHHGPGYRVYFVRRGEDLAILLGGGDKSSQDRDIRNALLLAKEV
ncbi:MAG: type II toxin-antitoxin system RelE/ParE family toxin [Alphaproteobacteria bacterium]|nr:type II toxin-antitoxin system RelE/ParE family toxin [Alphaproteobacteria bacterium]